MSWHKNTMFGGDSESTGVDVFTDRIVTFTIVKIADGQLADQREYLLDPGIEIPEGATKVHGITTEHAREHGVHPIEALPEIADTVASVLRARLPLVFFNAAYDLSLLEVELQRHNLPTLSQRLTPELWHGVVDPMVLGKGLEHNLRKHFRKGVKFTLPDLCQRYGVPFTETHDATADATGATLLAAALAEDEPMFAEQTPLQLHTLQKTWRRGQMDGLREFFDKKGQDHDGCDPGWPMHTRLTQVGARA